MNIMRAIRERLKKCDWLYALYREIKLSKRQRKKLWAVAVAQFAEGQPKEYTLRDYKRSLRRQMVSFKEYHDYEFWRLSNKERCKYISEWELNCIYRKVVDKEVVNQLFNKLMTLLRFENYVHRAWLCPYLSTFEEFSRFVSTHDSIIKPINGSLGIGVFKVKKDEAVDLRELYDKCFENYLIVEECVSACHEMEEFHPQSLNTLRVMTIAKDGRMEVVASMFRMGTSDNVVDNGSRGGILAPVEIRSGVVCGEGKNKEGKVYIYHPDSQKAIKGFVIPHWDKVLETCREMSKVVKEAELIGWDLCVLENGEIELIEANSTSNIMGLQVAHGYGLKDRIQTLGKDVLGYNVIKKKYIWSRPRNHYYETQKYIRLCLENPNQLLNEYIASSSEIHNTSNCEE